MCHRQFSCSIQLYTVFHILWTFDIHLPVHGESLLGGSNLKIIIIMLSSPSHNPQISHVWKIGDLPIITLDKPRKWWFPTQVTGLQALSLRILPKSSDDEALFLALLTNHQINQKLCWILFSIFSLYPHDIPMIFQMGVSENRLVSQCQWTKT
jgi:hypothetical protein